MPARLHSALRFAPARVVVDKRADGATLLRSPLALGEFPRALGVWLEHWANKAPQRTFLAERAESGLDERHHLHRHGRRLAVPGGGDRFV